VTEKQAEPETSASLMDYAAVRLHYEMTTAKAALAAQRAELADFAKTACAPQPRLGVGSTERTSPPAHEHGV